MTTITTEALLPCPFCGENTGAEDIDHLPTCYFKVVDKYRSEPANTGDLSAIYRAWNQRAALPELFAAQPAELHQHLLDMLGAKDHADAGRIIGELHAAARVAAQPHPDGFKEAWSEFDRKTQWVQDTAQPHELGMHRADVLRQRIERLQDRLDAQPASSAGGQEAVFFVEDDFGLWQKTDQGNYSFWEKSGSRKVMKLYVAPVAAGAAPQAVDLAEVERAMLYHVGKHATAYVMAELRALASQQKESSDGT